jgi:hypothetical protein
MVEWQVQGPEFKLYYLQRRKEKKKRRYIFSNLYEKAQIPEELKYI